MASIDRGREGPENSLRNKDNITTLTTLSVDRRNNAMDDNGKTFHCFPHLPSELQLHIWRIAVSSRNEGKHVLPVTVSLHPKPTQGGSQCVFSISRDAATTHAWSADIFNIGLSSACYASRSLYLSAFQASLPTAGGGVIRYDPVNTIIFIQNMSEFAIRNEDNGFQRALSHDASLGRWPAQIQHLGMPRTAISLEWDVRFTGLLNFAETARCFGGLRNVVALYLTNTMSLLLRQFGYQAMRDDAERFQGVLRRRGRGKSGDLKVSVVDWEGMVLALGYCDCIDCEERKLEL